MSIFRFLSRHVLLILTLFLLAFIPLYPKLPLVDINRTWVYIRVEDFLIAITWLLFFIQLWRKKASLKTPLTIPIIVFWLIGGLATLHGVIFLFPSLEDVFPHVALLHYLRRIEYLSLFFLGYAALAATTSEKMRKRYLSAVIVTLVVTFLAVFVYGIGQRYLGFPAYLTMNEEFAKGIPLRLSALARISSTFAGHYDLAAYLGIFIPLMAALVFGFKKWWLKLLFFLTGVSGLILLLMTASRVSFGVYLVSISFLLVLLKKKIFIIPVLVLSLLLMQSFQGISQRFASTFTQVDLVVDARTGEAIGIAENYTEGEEVVLKEEESTGENLPQGSKYINVPSSENGGTRTEIAYERHELGGGGDDRIISRTGEVIVKKAFAYDVSFTTRMQGTWPRAWEAFQRNIFFGSGYSSISLASDNNYLRILGEVGILGLLSYLGIFAFFFIYCFKVLPSVKDPVVRTFTLGMIAGIVGLMLNAVLIDVFEASKVAFVLWLIMGVTLGMLSHFQTKPIYFLKTLRDMLLSIPALLVYLGGVALLVFYPVLNNYFVGDDFTWLRWVADCQDTAENGFAVCGSVMDSISGFFLHADNFFYRPGTKLYFYTMYPIFEIFPLPYHAVSLFLHAVAGVLIFFIFNKILANKYFAFIGAFLFLMFNVHAEALSWISVTGSLIASVAILFGLLMYMYFVSFKKWWLYVLAFLSISVAPFFQEFAVVGPLMLLGYDLAVTKKWTKKTILSKLHTLIFFLPIALYAYLRMNAQSIWMQGDYSYSIPDLPFNIAGNLVGYFFLTLIGSNVLPFYQNVRNFGVENIGVVGGSIVVLVGVGVVVLWKMRSHFNSSVQPLLLAILFFVIPLLPFLGLGNIATRYTYLSMVGIALLLVVILRAFYAFTAKWNTRLAAGVVAVLIVLYSSYNIFELQTINKDWQKAGSVTNNLLVDLNFAFLDDPVLKRKPVFYFINVPIRYGEAWVFPAGLEDSLWFSLRQDTLEVRKTTSVEEAIQALEDNPRSVRVFEFMEDGAVIRVQRTKEEVTTSE